MTYAVVEVSDSEALIDEPMGTKNKFWLKGKNEKRQLFKYARVNNGIPTGEDYSEKITFELSRYLNIPCATVDLAICNGMRGTLCVDVTRDIPYKDSVETGTLIHGNQIIPMLVDSAYPASSTFRAKAHTIEAIHGVLTKEYIVAPANTILPNGVTTSRGVFAGYLMLDALVGNTDRHHENWAIIDFTGDAEDPLHLSPSFDHASSLGRELLDSKIDAYASQLPQSVQKYSSKARSAIYASIDDSKPLSTMGAFFAWRNLVPNEADAWLEQLRNLKNQEISAIIEAIPSDRMSSQRKLFVQELVAHNRDKLLSGEVKDAT